MDKFIALDILSGCSASHRPDFFTLTSSQVSELLAFADAHKYRKPRHANGSRGRYFYAYVLRVAGH